MPEAQRIQKAYLQELAWTRSGTQPVSGPMMVQFNPQTLKINFTNQKVGGDQRGGSAIQFVGKGATKLSLDLLFDVTAPLADGTMKRDVRELTQGIAYFLKPKKKVGKKQYIPPGVRFVWGSFLFEGIMDSMNETLEFFSNEGKPLRATVSITLSRQDIYLVELENSTFLGPRFVPGTLPVIETRSGDTIQQMTARAGGEASDWIPAAAANNIENPRQLTPGTLLDLSAGTGGIGDAVGGAAGAAAAGGPAALEAAATDVLGARVTGALQDAGGGGLADVLQAGQDLVAGATAAAAGVLQAGEALLSEATGALSEATGALERLASDVVGGRLPGGLNPNVALEVGKQLLGDPSRVLSDALGSRSVEELGLQAARELRNRATNPR